MRDRLQQIDLALQKGIGLMKKLGQFSRAQEFQSKPFEINHAVNTALKLARPLFGSRIRVKLALAPDLPVVEGDSGEIEQALVNLILNAVDAMPNGGELSLSTELMQHEAHGTSGEKPGCFVLVTVGDTGVGIPEDIQPRIFEPFFTTKAEKRGTGLGLPKEPDSPFTFLSVNLQRINTAQRVSPTAVCFRFGAAEYRDVRILPTV
jgi:signal transduction histidine kinase